MMILLFLFAMVFLLGVVLTGFWAIILGLFVIWIICKIIKETSRQWKEEHNGVGFLRCCVNSFKEGYEEAKQERANKKANKIKG